HPDQDLADTPPFFPLDGERLLDLLAAHAKLTLEDRANVALVGALPHRSGRFLIDEVGFATARVHCGGLGGLIRARGGPGGVPGVSFSGGGTGVGNDGVPGAGCPGVDGTRWGRNPGGSSTGP